MIIGWPINWVLCSWSEAGLQYIDIFPSTPFLFPPKHAHTINFTSGPLRTPFIQSFSHFSYGVRNTHISCGFFDFSTEHSSLQITLSQSSTVKSLWAKAQARRFSTCSSFESGRLAARHFFISSSCKTRWTVQMETLRAVLSRNSRSDCCRFSSDFRTMYRRALASRAGCLPS